MNNNIIVIPDVHGRDFWQEAVAGREDSKIVFLGDYMDPYCHEGINTEQAWQGLQDIMALKRMHPENITLLLGNHDLHYLNGSQSGCRMDMENRDRNKSFFEENLGLFDIAHEENLGGTRALFSHAGVTYGWLAGHSLPAEGIAARLNGMLHGREHLLLLDWLDEVSFWRGGDNEYGSPVWADEQETLGPESACLGYTQIFGHSQGDCVRDFGGYAFCMDCRKAFEIDLGGRRIKALQKS